MDKPTEQDIAAAKAAAVVIKHHIFIPDAEGEAIASAVLYRKHGVLWITNVQTEPGYRRNGLIKRVLSEAMRVFGGEPIYLTVSAYTNMPVSDEELHLFYARYGFEPQPFPGGMLRPADKG